MKFFVLGDGLSRRMVLEQPTGGGIHRKGSRLVGLNTRLNVASDGWPGAEPSWATAQSENPSPGGEQKCCSIIASGFVRTGNLRRVPRVPSRRAVVARPISRRIAVRLENLRISTPGSNSVLMIEGLGREATFLYPRLPNPAVLLSDIVRTAIPGVNQDPVFAPTVLQEFDIQGILAAAAGHGYSLARTVTETPRRQELELELAALRREWPDGPTVAGRNEADLRRQRDELRRRLAEGREEVESRRREWEHNAQIRREELESARDTLARWEEEVRRLDEQIEARRRRGEEELRRLETSRDELVRELREQLARVESHLRQARDTQRQLEARSRDLDALAQARGVPFPRVPERPTSICLVESLARQLDDLLRNGAFDIYRDRDPARDSIEGFRRPPRALTRAALQDLRAEVGALCRELGGRRELDRAESVREEVGQIAQCAAVHAQWIHGLEKQQRQLQAELDQVHEHGPDWICDELPTRGDYADYLDDYGRFYPERWRAVVHACDARELPPIDSRESRELQIQWEHASEQRREAAAKWNRLREQFDRGSPDPIWLGQLPQTERELREIEAEIRRLEELAWRSRRIAELQAELATLTTELRPSPWSLRADALLGQLSQGRWISIEQGLQGHSWPRQVHSTTVGIEPLPGDEKHLFALSLRLSLTGLLAASGVHHPMVVSEAMTQRLTIEQLEFVAAEAARVGQQILIFVSSAQAAALSTRGRTGFQMIEVPPFTPSAPLAYVDQVRFQPRAYVKNEANPYVAAPASVPSRSFEYLPPDGEPRRFRIDPAHQDAPLHEPREGRGQVETDMNMSFASVRGGFHRDLTLAETGMIPLGVVDNLATLGLRTVGDFLAVSPFALDRDLARWRIAPQDIRRWRQELSLRCSVPDLTAEDARILIGVGIRHGSDLAEADERRLYDALQRQALGWNGHPDAYAGLGRYSLARLAQWIRQARASYPRTRDVLPAGTSRLDRDDDRLPRRRESSDHGLRSRRRRSSQPDGERPAVTIVPRNEPRPAPQRSAGPRGRSTREQRSAVAAGTPRFFLNLLDSVVNAPSIGAKTAEAMRQCGIHTIADFLQANVADLAARLNLPRVKSETLREWQAQTTLTCRVPELRGHDAQILVACGVETVEQLATLRPDELWRIVGPFTRTNECKRLVRNGTLPTEQEIATWCESARLARTLQTA